MTNGDKIQELFQRAALLKERSERASVPQTREQFRAEAIESERRARQLLRELSRPRAVVPARRPAGRIIRRPKPRGISGFDLQRILSQIQRRKTPKGIKSILKSRQKITAVLDGVDRGLFGLERPKPQDPRGFFVR